MLFLKDVGNVTEWLEERARKIYAPRPMVQAGRPLLAVEPKFGGDFKLPKMDGENIMENPMNKWDDLGV